MKPVLVEYMGADMDEVGSSMAMDVDDVDALDMFSDNLGAPISCFDTKLADADFFNSFADDFDDADIN